MMYGLPPPEPEIVKIRVLMLKTSKATLDGGATVNEFEAGQEYDLPDWLAEAFFRGGEADPAEAHVQDEATFHGSENETENPAAPTRKVKNRRAPHRAEFGAAGGQ